MAFIKIPVKGMADMLPADMRLREHVLGMIKETYAKYGFMQIETPMMEHIENLTSKQGGDNEKLIFKVMKRGRDLEKAIAAGNHEYADNGMRYDLTVPLARFYANNREQLPSPFKSLQIGSVWRADNPQKGRFRQFTQCDIDILGDDSNLAEIELITATCDMLTKIFAEAGIRDFTIHINDRQILFAIAMQAGFTEEQVPSVLITLDKYDKIGLEGIEKELLENGYPEDVVKRYLSIYDGTEAVSAAEFCSRIDSRFLSPEAAAGIQEIIDCAEEMTAESVSVMFDPTLVRGMGYYTGPIFEITLDEYSFSVAGGGRYDKMIGKFSGQDVSASGFSIGFERIITILRDKLADGLKISGDNLAILVEKGADMEKKKAVFAEAKELRAAGKTVSIQPMKKNVKQQILKLEAEGFTEFKKVYRD
ncbi:MAG: histidine--tRNA ligase [Anaerovoracaceae bacterium]